VSTDLDKILEDTAEKLAQDIPEGERAIFKKDYIEIIGNLNRAVDSRLKVLEEDLASIVAVHGNPHYSANVLAMASKAVRHVSNTLLEQVSPFHEASIRSLIADAAIDAIRLSVVANVEHQRRIEERVGRKRD
jgi:protein associated with RNAse G/E